MTNFIGKEISLNRFYVYLSVIFCVTVFTLLSNGLLSHRLYSLVHLSFNQQ
jgi:hypothetical protein